MPTAFLILYLAIGTIFGIVLIFANPDVVEDMSAAELGKFLVHFAFTWPSVFIGEEEEE